VLLDVYCEAQDIPPERVVEVSVNRFLDWFRELDSTCTFEIRDAYIEQAGVDPVAWDALVALAHDPLGANRLAGVWPQVVLKNRGEPAHGLESLHVIVLLRWRDGKAAPLSSWAHVDLAEAGTVLDDGAVCTLVQTRAHDLMEMIASKSLDTIHDDHAVQANDHAFDVLMGLMLKVIRGARILDEGSTEAQALHPNVRGDIEMVFRLLQGMFRPPLAPQVREYLEARRAERYAQLHPPESPQPEAPQSEPSTGGFDS
jgi:hypothetical protein